MVAKAVIDAVEARLGATWTSLDGTSVPVFGINTNGQTPIDGSPFIEVQYPVANENQITIGAPGANIFRESGGIRFVLNIRRGLGVAQGMGWADELRALFRGKKFGGVKTWGVSSPVLDNSNDAGNYWTLAFVALYYFDING
jgi:hypothetical protein